MNLNLDPKVQASLLRFGSLIVAGVAGALVYNFIPDPGLKTQGAGLVAFAILGVEEAIKTNTTANQ